MSFDVVVVGFGFAGGVAAMAAHDAGARVLLLEKQPDPGGISVCSAGGLRIARDAGAAFEYLTATNAGTTPAPVLRTLAEGMTRVAGDVQALAEACGARVGLRDSPGNYPLPGADTSALRMSMRCRASMRGKNFHRCAVRRPVRGCSKSCLRACGGAALRFARARARCG